jgi:hypothetical protein
MRGGWKRWGGGLLLWSFSVLVGKGDDGAREERRKGG